MKKLGMLALAAFALVACNKVEEKINSSIDKTAEHLKAKAKTAVQESVNTTISESLNTIANAENAVFHEVYPGADTSAFVDFKGKKVKFPNGSPAYIFKYKADRDAVLKLLEAQSTSDENRSEAKARKIDGQSIINKIAFVEKFLPEGLIDSSFLQKLKSDKNIEFYRLKRFPSNTTLIFNPADNQIFQFVEILK